MTLSQETFIINIQITRIMLELRFDHLFATYSQLSLASQQVFVEYQVVVELFAQACYTMFISGTQLIQTLPDLIHDFISY